VLICRKSYNETAQDLLFQLFYYFIVLATKKKMLSLCSELRVGIATGYELDGQGSNPRRGEFFLFSTTSSTMSITQGMKLTAHIHLVPRSRILELYRVSTMKRPDFIVFSGSKE
jgi:hypothetical protein